MMLLKVSSQEITVSLQNFIYSQLRLHFKGTYPEIQKSLNEMDNAIFNLAPKRAG